MAPLIIAALSPFVKDLFANGLSMLGNAVMTKGKDYVEKQLGVVLPDETKPLSAEQLVSMRTVEFDHEERLREFAVREAELDLERQKAELADTANAREREVTIATSEHAPLLNKIIGPVLALLVVCGGGFMLYNGAPDVRTAAAGLISTVLGYFFGTSVGSREKQQMIERLTK